MSLSLKNDGNFYYIDYFENIVISGRIYLCLHMKYSQNIPLTNTCMRLGELLAFKIFIRAGWFIACPEEKL